jgi:hypothetical protein
MIPGQYNHQFTAGDDYDATILIKENGVLIDTSAYTFQAEIRTDYLPTGTLVDSFTVTPVSGGCVLSLTSAETLALGEYSRLVWDLQSESPDVRTWITGVIKVRPHVTEE